jgi:hypothetical protein
MMPTIATYARLAFRHRNPEAREEAVEECLANALVAYVRLVQLDKVSLAYPTVLARYAVAQINDGRKVGSRLNVQDVSSAYCQRRKKIAVERLDKFDHDDHIWREILVEDRRAGPAEVAATRVDFSSWLKILPGRLRRIAEILASGETTTAVARRFCVSAGRISQIRGELCRSWQQFQGELMGTPSAAVA